MTQIACLGRAPAVSVSIVCYENSYEEILCALNALLKAVVFLQKQEENSDEIHAEIMLLNNSAEQKLNLDQLSEIKLRLNNSNINFSLIQGHGNIGYGAAQNIAITMSTAPFHLVMNPDVIVSETTLHEGITYLNNNPTVALVSPFTTNAEGDKQYLCKQYPTVFSLFLRGFMPTAIQTLFRNSLDRYEMRSLSEEKPNLEIPIISGCFMLGQTKALREVSGFDESYFLYFEDFDLSMRLRQCYKLAYLPSMKIIHFGGNAGGKGIRHILMFIRSAYKFFSTYGWR